MKSYRLTPTRRRLCRPLIRSSLNSFAIQAVKRNALTRAIIVKVIGEMLHKEVACLCSDDLNSIMKQKDVNCYKKFDMIIEKINGEIELVAPIPELPTVLLFAGLSCIFSDFSALSCIFSLRPAFFSHLKNGLFVKSLQLVTRLMV